MLINASATGQQSIGTLIILGGQNLPQGLGHEVMAQQGTTDNADSDGLDKNALTVKHPARKAWTFLASPLALRKVPSPLKTNWGIRSIVLF